MKGRVKWARVGLSGLFVLAAMPAHAQISSLGKGWVLDVAGSLTSAPSEVISGNGSINGTYFGSNSFTPYLLSDPTFVRLAGNQTFTVAVSYRIVSAGSAGFEFGFFSSEAGGAGPFVPTRTVNGASGASGTASLTATLFNHPDYAVGFKIVGTGAIVIDDIRVTDSGAALVAWEGAEGPVVGPGPLNFQISDAITLFPEGGGSVRSVAANDLDGDAYPEAILTLTSPANGFTNSLRPIVVDATAGLQLTTANVFPNGAPTTKHSPVTLFTDINGDGLPDLLFAEAQYDGPYTGPRTGPGIGVALNLGNGTFRNVQPLIPSDQQTNRSYSLVAGDILGDGQVNILLSDEDDGANTALLRWNGNGFNEQRSWIAPSLWKAPANLVHHDWLVLADLDGDSRQDLVVGGGPAPCTPNLQVLYGAAGGFSASGLLQLPNGLFGQAPCASFEPVGHNASLGPIVVADFNNDGLPDIFAAEEEVLNYQPGVITDTNEPSYQQIRANGGAVFANVGIQVFMNQGSRRFSDVSSSSSAQNLGRRHYFSLAAIDLNHDGFIDVVGSYTTKYYAGVRTRWGATFFLNDGTGAFQVVDGSQMLPVTTTPSTGQQWNLGSFVPTVVTTQRTEGIAFDWVGDCGGPGGCYAPQLAIYKVVANASLGTGPNFVDPASLGVPGFNEFYYLRHHPDAAAAVQAGQYASGLAHYQSVGSGKGYLPFAPRLAVDHATLYFGAVNTGTALTNVTAGQPVRVTAGSAATAWSVSVESTTPWVQIAGGSGTGTGQFTVNVVSAAGLPTTGTVTATLRVVPNGAADSPQLVSVRLTLTAPATTTAPFGSFDTPVPGVVQGSIAVTGWALDDIEVSRVEIWRDLTAGETTVPFNAPGHPGHGRVFIATALFVPGARPDVEAAYATSPLAYRAGWGYLLLTWGLWNQGNGAFTLYAFAFDTDGHATTLGTKAITASNQTATKPFGGIDTPGYGKTVTANFWNFGWALTPNPNTADSRSCTIANGQVSMAIDSGPLIPVTYGGARTDIASAFPGFSNGSGGGGAYYLDVSTLANGTHAIGWFVVDSCGRAEGIGSRFFTIAK